MAIFASADFDLAYSWSWVGLSIVPLLGWLWLTVTGPMMLVMPGMLLEAPNTSGAVDRREIVTSIPHWMSEVTNWE